MQDNKVKIYACKKAIKISKPVIKNKKPKGIIPKAPMPTIKPAITFKIICPANMLAANLIDNEIGRIK